MNKEIIILLLACLTSIALLLRFVPKEKLRQAAAIFTFKQSITWIFGLLVVEFRLIEYPVTFLSYATRASLTFEYIAYPSLCVLFNLYYPFKESRLKQFLHYFYYCTAMTAIESLMERYTEVIRYLHWHWSLTWATLLITFFLSNRFYAWSFRLKDNVTQ